MRRQTARLERLFDHCRLVLDHSDKRMRRRIFNLLAALSLLAGIAVAGPLLD
jgi:hypothetical protein